MRPVRDAAENNERIRQCRQKRPVLPFPVTERRRQPDLEKREQKMGAGRRKR